MIGFVLFLNFLETELKWQRFFRGELLVTDSFSAVFMPLVVYYVLSSGLNPAYRIGLLLTAIAPSGVMMLAISRFVPNKDYNLILSNFLFTTFGSILYIPLMLKWLVGAAIQIKIAHLFFQTAA